MNIAIILAAGSGTRVGMDLPKQFVSINGKMLLEYSIEQFQLHPQIDEVAVVVSSAFMKHINTLKDSGLYSKLKVVLQGGEERYQSSLAALKHYENHPNDVILLHDAARPLISQQLITEVLNTMKNHAAAAVAMPATDTIFYSIDNEMVNSIPDRKKVYYAQTPQAFRIKTLKDAFALGLQDPQFAPTDDCSVVFKYLPEHKIAIVKGENLNRKITYQDDLQWLKVQLQK